MRAIIISDTHNRHEEIELPAGDLLIHCGDISRNGTYKEISRFATWLAIQPFKHKIIIAGNHDWLFEREPKLAQQLIREAGATYLENESVEIKGLLFYGTPITPQFGHWAFMRERRVEIARYWKKIPDNVDVVISHGGCHGIGDEVYGWDGSIFNAGCEDLLARVQQLKQLKLFCSGHLHSGTRQTKINNTVFVNASICDEAYKAAHKPIVIDLPDIEESNEKEAPSKVSE